MYSTPTIYVSYIYNCTQKNNSASTQKNLKGKSKVPQLSVEKKLGLKNPINIMFLTIDDDPTSENENKYSCSMIQCYFISFSKKITNIS